MRPGLTLPLALLLLCSCGDRVQEAWTERADRAEPTSRPDERPRREAPAPENRAKAGRPELNLVVSAGDKDQPIRIGVGRRFGVSLTENASIGYQWSALSVPNNLRSLGRFGVSSGDGEPRPGASHGMVFHFEAVRAGRSQLSFQRKYRGDPDQQLTFQVVVE